MLFKIFISLVLIKVVLFAEYKIKKDEKELVYREGIVYEKFSDIPFSGNGVLIDKYQVLKVKVLKGKFHGEIKSYYQSTGNLAGIVNYVNGVEKGTMKIFTEEGNLYSEIEYKDGLQCEGWYKYLDTNYILKDCKKTGTEVVHKNGKSGLIYWENGIKIKEKWD